MTANVFVNIPVKSIAKAYTYRVPEELAFLSAGWRVLVPFGGRKVEGFILETAEQAAAEIQLKDILGTVDDEAWFTPEMIEASRWMADFYLCSLAEIMRLFMPGKSGLKIEVCYGAREEARNHLLLQAAPYRAVYEALLAGGTMSRLELKKQLPACGEALPEILEKLLSYQVIYKDYEAKKRASALYEKYVCCQRAVDDALLAEFSRRPAQRKLLELLREKPQRSMAELQAAKVSAATVKAVAAAGVLEIRQRRVLRDSYAPLQAERQERQLTDEQQAALQAMEPAIEARRQQTFLLHGVTGSGKTQVYIEAAAKVRAQGRRVIVLVPEIALTGQLVQSFKAYFSQDIIVMHSRLSIHERNDAILRVRQGQAGIIIGARSALFTPAEQIGLIIMDEEQDMSYKQDEAPRYHARVVAAELARLYGAVLVLGSATPSLETFYHAMEGDYTLLRLTRRIGDMPLPEVRCVDMRQEMKRGNRKIISRGLHDLILDTMGKKEQLILMLNRRGFSTFVMCRSCGHVIKCRFCGLPLVYHKNGRLSCHHCDVQEPVPDVCPQCGSRYIKYFGSGTEKLEQELHELVPAARVVRMDRDTTNGKFAHARILDSFKRGEYDILLGTQMVAKGHDIPNVTAVGIISADSSLNMPDFRAAERCFMLITQTAGRAGRGDVPGRVVVQSYNPEHYAVQCGIRQDYQGFYEAEAAMRRQLFFPPFSRIVKLTFQHEKEEEALGAAATVKEHFQQSFKGQKNQQIIGPAPAMIANYRGIFRFCLLIKTAELSAVQVFLRTEQLHLRPEVQIDVDPITTM